MKHEIKVPPMGESISEATVGELLVASGEQVSEEQEILELETDKVNQVLYAPAAGQLTFEVQPGDSVQVGQVIGHIKEGGEGKKPEKPAPEPKAEPREESKEESKEESGEEPKPETKEESKPEPAPIATKAARLSVDQAVTEMSQAGRAPAAAPSAALPKRKLPEGASRRKMSKIRQTIARRLVEVKQTTAMLTTFNEVDLSEVIALRKRYKEIFQKKYEVKLGFMSFFVKACVSALQELPDINSYIEGEDIVHHGACDVGIAIGAPKGLVVPVVRGCEHLSFAEIEQAIVDYAGKAKEGKLKIEDLQGGSFTITNGGIYGSMLSTPILNPPQSAILGMHAIQERAVVQKGEVVIRPMMYLALSYDHRIVDGKEAVTFLVHVKERLEDPSRLELEV